MAANRKTPAPSNTGSTIPGTSYTEDVNEEVVALWDHSFTVLGSVGGTANAITATCPVPLDTDKAGQKFILVPALANTATAVTLRVDGKTTKTLLDRNGAAPAIGRLTPNIAELVWDQGTTYRLLQDKQVVNAAPKINSYVYQVTNNVNGGSTTGGAWNIYPLNAAVLADIPGSSFDAANFRFTLAAGTYEVDADAFSYNGAAALALYNVTDAAYVTTGMTRRQSYIHNNTRLNGRFQISASKVFELRIWTATSNYLGLPSNITAPATQPEHYGFLTLKSYN
jgi:hypothetical protein